MHDQMELVEKLIEKTKVSYADAKEALERANWDMLDALVWLESQGKIKTGPETAYSQYTTQSDKSKSKVGAENFKRATRSFWDWIKMVIDKGNTNSLEVYKKDERKLSIPVTVFVILLILGFWIVLPLIIVSLFFGFRYSYSGPDLGKDSVNRVMGKATDVAENIVNEIKRPEHHQE